MVDRSNWVTGMGTDPERKDRSRVVSSELMSAPCCQIEPTTVSGPCQGRSSLIYMLGKLALVHEGSEMW